MSTRIRCWLPAIVAASMMGLSAPRPADAGVIPWAYNAIFGTGYSPAYYHPTYTSYGGYGYRGYSTYRVAYYRGCYKTYYPTYYAPSYCGTSCGCSVCSCNPCGCPRGGCAIGCCGSCVSCPATDSSSEGQFNPTPSSPPRTYSEEPESGSILPRGDGGFQTPLRGEGSGEASGREAFKTVPQRTTEDPQESDVRPLDLDAPIAHRVVPQRSRLIYVARYQAPQVARVDVRPQGWVPIPTGTKLASK